MIRNRTRGTTLCTAVEVASSPFQRALGLMFRSSLEGGMLFSFGRGAPAGMWTAGMRIPIDILWLDHDRRIIRIKERALPWRFMGGCTAWYVLELPAGTVQKTRTRVGDLLSFAGEAAASRRATARSAPARRGLR
ncbi:MAG: DUF192 domain-containing protein [Candidatus Aenigmarchaeota archaeon]|nr:DUF192 domain-containing protein [Candidatus Aenigmarchaeota archaeon]